MKPMFVVPTVSLVAVLLLGSTLILCKTTETQPTPIASVKLPKPSYRSDVSVEQALLKRRSVRSFDGAPLKLADLSQLLWAAQGITHPAGYRTAPSAGALYPLEVYVMAGNVTDLPAGTYKYDARHHRLDRIVSGDKRRDLSAAALGQSWVKEAPASIVFAAIYERTTRKYGQKGRRYVHMEVGGASQNVYLQVVTLDLGTVFVGAFDDEAVKRTMSMADEEEALCIMPVGREK